MNDDFENNPILQKLLGDLAGRAEQHLKRAVVREGKVLTGELLESIRAEAVTWGKGWISGHVSYSELLRIKDMKVLNYTTIPPLGPLERWVEQVGVSRFAYVPGYPQGVRPATESEAITRIAKGIQYNLKAHPNVRRGYRGIYNDTLNFSFVPSFQEDLRMAATVLAGQQFVDAFGFETFIPQSSEPLNASRIQAAWNARDTRLERKNA